MVVILAGYEAEVEALMSANPGLKSRFSEKLHFPDFDAADAAELLRSRLLRDCGLGLDGEAEAALPGLTDKVGGVGGARERDFCSGPPRRYDSVCCLRRVAPQGSARVCHAVLSRVC
jgi:hypothetical protein